MAYLTYRLRVWDRLILKCGWFFRLLDKIAPQPWETRTFSPEYKPVRNAAWDVLFCLVDAIGAEEVGSERRRTLSGILYRLLVAADGQDVAGVVAALAEIKALHETAVATTQLAEALETAVGALEKALEALA